MRLISKEKNQEQFKAKCMKTLESRTLSMSLFLCEIFSHAHWECEASSKSNSSPCGKLKLIFRDLKQPLSLVQQAGERKSWVTVGSRNKKPRDRRLKWWPKRAVGKRRVKGLKIMREHQMLLENVGRWNAHLDSGPNPPTVPNSFCPRLAHTNFTHFGLLKLICLNSEFTGDYRWVTVCKGLYPLCHLGKHILLSWPECCWWQVDSLSAKGSLLKPPPGTSAGTRAGQHVGTWSELPWFLIPCLGSDVNTLSSQGSWAHSVSQD